MRPVIVIFEIHSEYVVPLFFEHCVERLVQDKYLAFCEESNAYASYTFDNAVKLLTLSIDKLKQQRIPSHLLDSSQRQQIEQSIISSEQRLAIYRVLSRFSNAKLYGIDNFLGKYRDALNTRSDLLDKVTVIRDQGIAQELESIRRKNEEQGLGIVVILGLNHHRVQHFLIKIGGQEVSKHYRFFYLYNKDSLSPDNLLAAEPGYGFDDVYPLGLTAIDCKSKRFEEVYRQIKTSLRGKSQVKINQGRLEQLLSLFQESIHEGEEAVKTLLRTGIATSHINQYLQDYPSSQIDRNKLFHLLIPILTHFNKTGLRYDGQQKILLDENPQLLTECQIPVEAVIAYQSAVDFLAPQIQQKFIKKNLADRFAKDFLKPLKTPGKGSSLLSQCGFFAGSLAVLAMGLILYYATTPHQEDQLNHSF